MGLYSKNYELPLNEEDLKRIDLISTELMSEFPQKNMKFEEIEIKEWIKESIEIAKQSIYNEVQLFPFVTMNYIKEGQY